MLNLRDAFFLPDDDAVELRAFTHGLQPRTVPDLMQRFADDWRERGVDAWNRVPNHWRPHTDEAVGWWSLPEYLGDHFVAPLLGAAHGTCMLQPNVHWSVQCLLSAPEPFADGRNEIVVPEGSFPSVLHSVQRWTGLRDVIPRIIPAGADGYVDRDAVLAAVGPKTAMVLISHIGFTTSEKLPDAYLHRLGDAVHRHGGLFVVDGYHATGSVAVQVEAIGADVYVGGLLKEACGSSGNSYVYVREGVDLTPALTGWFGDADPFGFALEPSPHPDVRRRFMAGTSAVASMYHAVEGVRVLLDVGLQRVREDSLAKTGFCIERARDAGIEIVSPTDERRGAMVILRVPAADRLSEYLKTEGIYTDSRKGAFLRMAPFVWNTIDEIDHTFDVIARALYNRSYHAASLPEAGGPVT